MVGEKYFPAKPSNYSEIKSLCFIGVISHHSKKRLRPFISFVKYRYPSFVNFQIKNKWKKKLKFSKDLKETENLKVLTKPLLSDRINECWTSLTLYIYFELSVLMWCAKES